jgi:hypothetical protein
MAGTVTWRLAGRRVVMHGDIGGGKVAIGNEWFTHGFGAV